MVRALGALERGAVTPQPQAEDGVTYAKKILKDEARIDWSQSAHEIDCHIRGLSPFPGAWTEVNGERLKVLYAEPVAGNGRPGMTLDDDLTVACGDGAVRLLQSAARRRQGDGRRTRCSRALPCRAARQLA